MLMIINLISKMGDLYIYNNCTKGNDLIMKLDADDHQQSIDQCTAAQTRATLTALSQAVNTALANNI